MDKVIVLIQLNGGNDGLNTVIPLDKYGEYFSARQALAIPESKIIKVTDKIGFHPSLTKLSNLYNDGLLGLIQNVGVANPDFSHFRAGDIWQSATDSNIIEQSGWQGRMLNKYYSEMPAAIKVGSVSPLAFQAQNDTMGITIASDKSFYDFVDGIDTPFPNTYGGNRMKYVHETRMQTEQYSLMIKQAASNVKVQSEYPDTELAKQLKIVARLIAGGMGTKTYMVTMNGFDTHSGQINSSDSTTGIHSYLLKELSEAIYAFVEDCKFLGIDKRVFGMTFSEFGRTVKSNVSFGTDHGAAAPLFYFGSDINSNRIIGSTPDLTTNLIPFEFDFRQIYASVLKYQEVSNTSEILFREFEALPIFGGTTLPPTVEPLYDMVLHKEGKHIVVYSDGTWKYI